MIGAPFNSFREERGIRVNWHRTDEEPDGILKSYDSSIARHQWFIHSPFMWDVNRSEANLDLVGHVDVKFIQVR